MLERDVVEAVTVGVFLSFFFSDFVFFFFLS